MKEFTFYWRDGKRQVLSGETPEDALNNAGYGFGAIGALDFYSSGNCHDYYYDSEEHDWRKS